MEIGRKIFGCLGDKVAVFFDFARKGASFVYGDDLVYGNQDLKLLSVFAFSVSIIIRLITIKVLDRRVFQMISIDFVLGVARYLLLQLFCFNTVLLRRHAMDYPEIGQFASINHGNDAM